MDAMSGIIAENLKRIRKENKWSLDTVSDMTGVSKSMLGQIERGESSPTISTLWKIATGLHISFTGLLEQSEKEAEIISKEEVNPWKQMANAIMWKPAMLSIFRQTDHMSMKTGVTAIHASAC